MLLMLLWLALIGPIVLISLAQTAAIPSPPGQSLRPEEVQLPTGHGQTVQMVMGFG